MAYDGYQNSPSPYSQMGHANQIDPNEYRPTSYTPPYPSQYGSDRLNMPQPSVPPMSSSPSNQYPHPYQDPNMWQQQQQQQQQQPPPPPPSQPPQTGRINDAVNSAFNNQADNSNYLPPEVLSQITATVIQQLKETGLNNLQGEQQAPYLPPRPPKPWSPVATNSVPSEAPPSPSLGMHNPSPTPTPIPAHEGTNFPPPPSASYSGTPRFSRPSPVPPLERRESPASQASDHSHRVETRPKPPPREEDATVTELTTLEKIWGKLFENEKPTDRLGQFLRGIAVHLIEAYPPENTLVITPEKMQKFYEDTKVSGDPYPWHDIFDDRTSSISRLFREVEAEHHLVQNKLNERPDIPGLTPRGFERWATLMIRTHPEKEYERLKKAVLNMPISNPDNKKERFPKEIPRRLFPEAPVLPLREEVDQFIMKHCGVDLPPITNEEIKQAAAHRHKPSTSSSVSGTEAASASFSERERKPYQASVSAVVDDDDEDKEIPPQPIERQRKPYTAQPGGGKNYDEKKHSGHRHTQSFSGGSIPKESLASSGQRHSEAYSQDPLYSRSGSHAFGGRSRSPSRGVNASDYRHSESDLLQSNGGRYSGTSPSGDYYYGSGAGTLTGDILEDNRRRRELERENEDLRLYESLREREKEREKSKYNDHFPARSSWSNDEDFYRGMLGGQGGGPVGGGSSGYDYKSYGFK